MESFNITPFIAATGISLLILAVLTYFIESGTGCRKKGETTVTERDMSNVALNTSVIAILGIICIGISFVGYNQPFMKIPLSSKITEVFEKIAQIDSKMTGQIKEQLQNALAFKNRFQNMLFFGIPLILLIISVVFALIKFAEVPTEKECETISISPMTSSLDNIRYVFSFALIACILFLVFFFIRQSYNMGQIIKKYDGSNENSKTSKIVEQLWLALYGLSRQVGHSGTTAVKEFYLS